MRFILRVIVLIVVLAGGAGCKSTASHASPRDGADYRKNQAERMTERDVQEANPDRRQPVDSHQPRRQDIIDQPR